MNELVSPDYVAEHCQSANEIAARIRGSGRGRPAFFVGEAVEEAGKLLQGGLSRAQVAERVGVSHSLIYKTFPVAKFGSTAACEASELTVRQSEVLQFAKSFLQRNDEFPPMWAIAKHFGWTSANAADQHIRAIARKGGVERNEIGGWRFPRGAA